MNVNLSKTEIEALIELLETREEPFVFSLVPKLFDANILIDEVKHEIENEAPYPLSDNQKQFVEDCVRLDLLINYNYSGRGMMGKKCPSVITSDSFLKTSAQAERDNMGMEFVFYARY